MTDLITLHNLWIIGGGMLGYMIPVMIMVPLRVQVSQDFRFAFAFIGSLTSYTIMSLV